MHRLCLGLVLLPWAAAQDVPAPARYEQARANIQSRIDSAWTPGLSLAVMENNQIVWAEGFGRIDLEQDRPATADSIYRLASISKPITATALMTLVDQGRLDLDKPVNDYLQGCRVIAHRGDAKDVTLRRLANHTAGLPTHWNFFYAPHQPPARTKTIADYGFCALPPGQATNYSNLAFGIIDHVVAATGKASFADYLQTAVLEPLGMRHTGVGAPQDKRDAAAVGYHRADDEFAAVADYAFDHPGASAVWSSPRDLMRLARLWTGRGDALGSVDGVRILQPASARAMMAPRAGDAGSKFGIGWAVGSTDGQPMISHTGGMPGVSTALRIFPDQGHAVAILTNSDNRRPTRETISEITSLLAEILPEPPAAAAVQAAEAAEKQPGLAAPDPSGTRPVDAAPTIGNRWLGMACHPAGPIPITLDWQDQTSGELTVGDATVKARLSTESSETMGPLVARCRAPWPTKDGKLAEASLQLQLRRHGDQLQGVAYVTRDRTSRLPYWVELRLADGPPEDALRVISYNILVGWRDQSVGRFLPGRQRRNQTSAWLAAQEPDVIAFQEMNGFTAQSLQGAAAAWRHPHVAMLKENGFPVALTSKTPIEVIDRHRGDLHHGMLHARTGGVDFVVVHLCPRPGVERKLREIDVAMECYQRARAQGRQVIILGDFNSILPADTDQYSPEALVRYRGWDYALDGDRPAEFCVGPLLAAGLVDSCAAPGSLPNPLPLPRIDFIFASPDLTERRLGSRWLCWPELLRWSDHPPVVADFR